MGDAFTTERPNKEDNMDQNNEALTELFLGTSCPADGSSPLVRDDQSPRGQSRGMVRTPHYWGRSLPAGAAEGATGGVLIIH